MISVLGPAWAAHIMPAAPAPRMSVLQLWRMCLALPRKAADWQGDSSGIKAKTALEYVSDPEKGRKMHEAAGR
jgi:hypothetical protein